MHKLYCDYGEYWQQRGMPAQYAVMIIDVGSPWMGMLRNISLADHVVIEKDGKFHWVKNRSRSQTAGAELTLDDIKSHFDLFTECVEQ